MPHPRTCSLLFVLGTASALATTGAQTQAPLPVHGISPVPKAAPRAAPLHMPRAVQLAYRKGTRSPDGRPGAAYWQNRARYSITVTALPPARGRDGNRADRLRQQQSRHAEEPRHQALSQRPQAGRPARRWVRATTTSHPACTSTRSPCNGQASRGATTRARSPGSACELSGARSCRTIRCPLSFDWHYDISKQSGREGAIDSTTFFLAYFYPRIAVYDDYNGWDTMDFTDQQEFYSDFNDYDVTVRVPANFIVWGTGTLRERGGSAAAGVSAALPGIADVGSDDTRRDERRTRGAEQSHGSDRSTRGTFKAEQRAGHGLRH